MSYKVLTDGNGGPVIRVVGLGDYIRFDAHNAALVKVNAERGALAAQLKHQNERAEMAEIFIEQLATELGAGATVAEVVDRVAQWLDADHGGRLAEVRADAIEAASNALYNAGIADEAASDWLVLYAAKVRGGLYEL